MENNLQCGGKNCSHGVGGEKYQGEWAAHCSLKKKEVLLKASYRKQEGKHAENLSLSLSNIRHNTLGNTGIAIICG